MVAGKQRIRNLVLLRLDIDAMTELKPLTYDEHKVTEAAFRGHSADPYWTDGGQFLYAELSAAIAQRAGVTVPSSANAPLASADR